MSNAENGILVGLDFSADSERAISAAGKLAGQLGVALHIVHVYEPLAVAASEEMPRFADVAERVDQERVARREQCTEVAARALGNSVAYTIHIVDAMALDGLMAAIDTLKPQMVVVGSHGRGAIKRLLLGSVSATLCRRSPVPVLVIPSASQIAEHEASSS